jgi:hypothetical protein
MSERGRKRIVYTLFVGAVGLGLLVRPWQGPRRSTDSGAPAPAQSPVEVNAAALVPQTAPSSANTPVSWKPAVVWPRDPFRGGDGRVEETAPAEISTVEPTEPLLTLHGVMTVDGQRVCVINGQVWRVGAVVEGWRIQRIDESQVRLARGTEALDLHLP